MSLYVSGAVSDRRYIRRRTAEIHKRSEENKGECVMFCGNCGKEIQDSSTFCPECGAKLGAASDNAPVNNAEAPADKAAKTKEEKRNEIIGEIIAGIIIFVIISALTGGFGSDEDSGNDKKSGAKSKAQSSSVIPVVTDDDYISAAKTLISERLNAPSTAIYSNEKIEARDDYGRTIVTFTVEAQNKFGGYMTSSCYVLIENYDPIDDSFIYNQAGVVMSELRDNEEIREITIKNLKKLTDWNKPLKKEEASSNTSQ